ncbi:MAG: hypothetical protein FWG85_01775 [Bacteroidetes bacterium]|nr:hypothetical protein [Bacteroidota bacterium]
MNKIQVTLTLIVISIFLSASVYADKNIRSPKAKERMDVVKKMKMLEAMDLDETKSEKFLVKLNAHNKQIDEKRKQQKEVVAKLNEAVKNNSKDINNLNDQLLNLHNEIHKLNVEKNQELRGVLSEAEFSKYLVFENKFMGEVFNCFMNHNSDVKGKDNLKKEKKTPNKKREKKTKGSHYFPNDSFEPMHERSLEAPRLKIAERQKDFSEQVPEWWDTLQKENKELRDSLQKESNDKFRNRFQKHSEQLEQHRGHLHLKQHRDQLEQHRGQLKQHREHLPDHLQQHFQKHLDALQKHQEQLEQKENE